MLFLQADQIFIAGHQLLQEYAVGLESLSEAFALSLQRLEMLLSDGLNSGSLFQLLREPGRQRHDVQD